MAMTYESDASLRKMAESAQTSNAATLAHRVLELQTSDKFRLAAMLLDLNKANMAEAVGTRACQEITLALLFMKPAKP